MLERGGQGRGGMRWQEGRFRGGEVARDMEGLSSTRASRRQSHCMEVAEVVREEEAAGSATSRYGWTRRVGI